MASQPVKSFSEEFSNDPFYLIQSNGTDKRYVVSLNEKIRIRMLLAGFINQTQDEVQIKIRDFDDPEKPVEYSGSVHKSKLHKLMTKHEDVIFHNGNHDFMLRDRNTGEYMVLDEHGLVFIYTERDYAEILKHLDAKYKPNEKLIYEFHHWHYCLPKGQEKLTALIKDLALRKE